MPSAIADTQHTDSTINKAGQLILKFFVHSVCQMAGVRILTQHEQFCVYILDTGSPYGQPAAQILTGF